MSSEPPDSLVTFLAEQGLSPDTLLYRATLPEFLSRTEDGSARISAHPDAGEAVVDIHHAGHTLVANHGNHGGSVGSVDIHWTINQLSAHLVELCVKLFRF